MLPESGLHSAWGERTARSDPLIAIIGVYPGLTQPLVARRALRACSFAACCRVVGAGSRQRSEFLRRLHDQIPEWLEDVLVHMRCVGWNDHNVSFANSVRLTASNQLAALRG